MGYHSKLRYLQDNQANLANYLAWKNMDKAQRQAAYATATAQGGTRVPVVRKPGFLIPMKASSTAKIAGAYPIFADNPGHAIATALKGILQPKYQKDTLPSGFTQGNSDGRLQPAIARLTERETALSPRTSRILKSSYKARKSDSASGGAGKNTEAQDITTTATSFESELSSALDVWVNAGNFRSKKLIPEIKFIL